MIDEDNWAPLIFSFNPIILAVCCTFYCGKSSIKPSEMLNHKFLLQAQIHIQWKDSKTF